MEEDILYKGFRIYCKKENGMFHAQILGRYCAGSMHSAKIKSEAIEKVMKYIDKKRK